MENLIKELNNIFDTEASEFVGPDGINRRALIRLCTSISENHYNETIRTAKELQYEKTVLAKRIDQVISIQIRSLRGLSQAISVEGYEEPFSQVDKYSEELKFLQDRWNELDGLEDLRLYQTKARQSYADF